MVSIEHFTRWINLPPTWNFRDGRQELESVEHRNRGSYRIKWSNDVLYEFGPSLNCLIKSLSGVTVLKVVKEINQAEWDPDFSLR